MYEWSEEHEAIIAVMRRFVDEHVRPHIDELEHEGLPPYGVLRTMYETFGLKDAARERFERILERKLAGGDSPAEPRAHDAALTIIPTIELSRVSPGLVTALGVSSGLAAGTINRLGTPDQMRRWALDL